MLYVKHVTLTCSEEAGQFIRDSLRDTADFIEDQAGDDPGTPLLVSEIRGLANEFQNAMLVPATLAEYERLLGIEGGS